MALMTGLYMSGLGMSLQKLKLMNWHKWIGVTTLALVAVRLMWRVINKPPTLPPAMSSMQQTVAVVAHVALYALMLVVPLLGWAYSSAAGFPVVWFGVLPLPDLAPRDRHLAELLKPLHQASSYFLLFLVVLHVFAALKHHMFDRDDLMNRMRPW